MIFNQNSGGEIAYEPKQDGVPKVTQPSSGSIASKEVAVTTPIEDESLQLRIVQVGNTLRLIKVK